MLMGHPELVKDVAFTPGEQKDEAGLEMNGHAVPQNVAASSTIEADDVVAEPVDDADKIDPARFEVAGDSGEENPVVPDLPVGEDDNSVIDGKSE